MGNKLLGVILCSLLLFSACGKQEVDQEEVLYQKAKESLNNKDYVTANTLFNKLIPRT